MVRKYSHKDQEIPHKLLSLVRKYIKYDHTQPPSLNQSYQVVNFSVSMSGLKPGMEYGIGVTAVKNERESLPATTNAATGERRCRAAVQTLVLNTPT